MRAAGVPPIGDGKNALGESVASGVYFYTLTAGDFTADTQTIDRKVMFPFHNHKAPELTCLGRFVVNGLS